MHALAREAPIVRLIDQGPVLLLIVVGITGLAGLGVLRHLHHIGGVRTRSTDIRHDELAREYPCPPFNTPEW